MNKEQKKPTPADAALARKKDDKFGINKDDKINIHDVADAIDDENKPQDDGNFNVNGVSFKMVKVECGTFLMGAANEPSALSYEYPQHEVTLTKDYFIGQTPVTQALWKAVMGSNPSMNKGDDLPVERVSWNDCQEFINRLNQITGKQFRLPTEAEWEFAAIGGGASNGTKYSGSNTLDEVAWNKANSGGVTHAVATKGPNELGLYDMSGNVNEWCQDWYSPYTTAAQVDPKGPATGSYKVYRGGAYSSKASECRCHYRYMMSADKYFEYMGLRLAL